MTGGNGDHTTLPALPGSASVNIETHAPDVTNQRERSTIEFPYGDLNDAIEVAKSIHSYAGLSTDPESLAGYMHQSARSGSFRNKTAAARIFRLVETERGKISLTPLGQRILNPAEERGAKAEAFLSVPLYQAIYDKYKGQMLPPTAALEREMVNSGVAAKQKQRARQAFERSAEQAHFFEHGKERLVPPASGAKATPPPPPSPRKANRGGRGGDGGGIEFHPFIEGLIQSLPEATEDYSAIDRVNWLRLAALSFDMIYGANGEIEITLKKRGGGHDDASGV